MAGEMINATTATLRRRIECKISFHFIPNLYCLLLLDVLNGQQGLKPLDFLGGLREQLVYLAQLGIGWALAQHNQELLIRQALALPVIGRGWALAAHARLLAALGWSSCLLNSLGCVERLPLGKQAPNYSVGEWGG